MSGVCDLIGKINTYVVNPFLLLIFAFATLVFVYGIVEFMWGLQQETDSKSEGKSHMLWGLVGMFVMVSAYAMLKLIAGAVGGNLQCA